MKKQILFLAFFVLALLTSVSNSFGQAPDLSAGATCITPTAITCPTGLGDELHPMAGKEYTYTVVVPTPAGTKQIHWLVTQDQTFIDATGLVAAAEAGDGTDAHIQLAGAGYNDPVAGTTSIKITWKAFTHDPNLPVFLVTYVVNDDGTCSTDNIEVWIIEPIHSFTLDIANIAADGGAEADLYKTCVAEVASAVYNIATNDITMNYGINYMFFIVNAANYSDSWMPSFEIGGAGMIGSRAVTAVEWAYPTATGNDTWHTTTATGAVWNSTDAVVASAGAGNTVAAAGECIIVRITIENNEEETIADAVISLAVDGVMNDPTTAAADYTDRTYADIHDADCTDDNFDNDVAQQTLTARPDINESNPAVGTFVPQIKN